MSISPTKSPISLEYIIKHIPAIIVRIANVILKLERTFMILVGCFGLSKFCLEKWLFCGIVMG